MKRGTISLLAGLAILTALSGCSDKKVAGMCDSRQIGEDCGDDCGCMTGLFCEGGKCRVVCTTKSECNPGEECQGNRCVKVSGQDIPDNTDHQNTDGDNTDHDNTDQDNTDQDHTDEAAKIIAPEIVPVAGTTAHGDAQVQVRGQVINGTAKDKNNNSVEINAGYWNQPGGGTL